MGAIATAMNLKRYSGGAEDFIAIPPQTIIDAIGQGTFKPPIGRMYSIDQIVEARRPMEDNSADGPIRALRSQRE